jgi:Zn-dependent protease with chaperone function
MLLLASFVFDLAGQPALAAADDPMRHDTLEIVTIEQPSARAVAFYRGGQWVWAGSQLISILIPLVLLITPVSVRLEKLAWQLGGGRIRAVFLFVAMTMVLSFMIRLPWSFMAGYLRMRAYGLSNQTPPAWLVETMKSLAVMIVIQSFIAIMVWGVLVVKFPSSWWLWTAAGTLPFLVAGVFLTPLVIDPIFNAFGPMKNKGLEREILAMAAKTGVGQSRVFEVDKSRQTKAVNAYVTGLFGSKRIVLWDTLLQALPPREVKAVVAHELGHYVLGHVRWGVLLGGLSSFGGLYLLNLVLQWLILHYGAWLRVTELSSLSAMLLLIVVTTIGELAFQPVSNSISRKMEHEADRFAIELTRDPASVALAFRTLQKENLSVPFPGLFYHTFRATHPSIGQRIEFANQYRPWVQGLPGIYDRYFSTQSQQSGVIE